MTDALPAPQSSPSVSEPEQASQVDRVQNAKEVHEQYWVVWQDQVEFAETLREKRKLYSAAIALVAALGVFRLSWTRNINEVPAIQHATVEFSLKAILAGALVILLIGAHKLYTERAYFSPRIERFLPQWLIRRLRRHLGSLWDGRAEQGLPHSDAAETVANPESDGRAISELVLSREEANEWLELSAERIWIEKAFRVRKAYLRLRQSNDRVKRRIQVGVALLGFSYVLLALVLVAYALSSDSGRSRREQRQGIGQQIPEARSGELERGPEGERPNQAVGR
jgi:hypothetical protein